MSNRYRILVNYSEEMTVSLLSLSVSHKGVLNTKGGKVTNSEGVVFPEVEISDRNPNRGQRPGGTRAPTLAVRPSLAQRGSLIPAVLWGHRCPPSVLRLAL